MRKIWVAIVIPMLWACTAERTAGEPANQLATDNESVAQGVANDLPVANDIAGAPDGRSRFTSIDPERCKLVEENVEEGGWSRRLCDGLAGYKLELTDSDLRQDIIVIPADGRRSELGLTEIVAKGAFNALGETAEWRGIDLSAPDMLIVRLRVAADPEGRKPDISNLVVVRLKPSVCVVAIVPPGAGQNEQARAVADRKHPACLGNH